MAHSYVSSTSTLNAGAGTSHAASAQNHTTGNLIVVAVYGYDSTGTQYPTVTGVTDTAGNTYYQAEHFNTLSIAQEVWYAYNITGHASNVVTATYSCSVIYRLIGVHQYSGGYTSGAPLDVHSTGSGTGTAMSCSAITTGYANELILGFFTINQTPTFTAGSGYTNREAITIGQTEDDVDVGAAGSNTVSMTSSISGGWAGVCAAFRAAVSNSLLHFGRSICRSHILMR